MAHSVKTVLLVDTQHTTHTQRNTMQTNNQMINNIINALELGNTAIEQHRPEGYSWYEIAKEYHQRVRESAKQQFPGMKVLSCPLDCGECPSKVSKKGHACDWFNGVVAIGVH